MKRQALKSANTRNLDQYVILHKQEAQYGKSSEKIANLVATAVNDLKPFLKPKSRPQIIDFGCGKSNLVEIIAENLSADFFKYDPAIPDYAELPKSHFDILINTDVLEHLDEAEIDSVLEDIKSLANHAYFNIATATSSDILPSGENAHKTVKSKRWWAEKLSAHFPHIEALPSKKRRATFCTWEISIPTRIKLYLNILGGRAATLSDRSIRRLKDLYDRKGF